MDGVRGPDPGGPGRTAGDGGRVLVIEGGAEAGRRLAEALGRVGLAARVCRDAKDGLHAFLRELPDLVVARASEGDPEGQEVLREIRGIADVPVLLVVGARAASNVLPAASDGEQIARLAAAIVAEGTAFGRIDPATTEAFTSGPHPVRLTAAEVRRHAQSELAAELERQLVECRGNLAEVARRMGKDRSTIRYHLRRFGMLVDERARQSSPSSRWKAYSEGSPTRTS